MTTVYGDLVRYRELFTTLFRRDLQARYKGSVLGLAWSLANPAVQMAVVALVGGLSLAVAALNAIYRDVEHLVAALLLPWFFLTPVLYTSETLPAKGWERLVDVLHWVNFAAPAGTAGRRPPLFGRPPP